MHKNISFHIFDWL